MNKQVEVLTKLKEYVQSGNNIRLLYADYNIEKQETCYCAIGFMMKECDVPEEDIQVLGSSHVISHFHTEAVGKLLDIFDKNELIEIQRKNDHGKGESYTFPEYIDDLIKVYS